MEFIEAVLLTVITASTPLLLAASGELVVERAGILNLGVEGMMIVGGACGFAGAYLTGSIAFGALCGILAGAALSAGVPAGPLGGAPHPGAAGAGPHAFRARCRRPPWGGPGGGGSVGAG